MARMSTLCVITLTFIGIASLGQSALGINDNLPHWTAPKGDASKTPGLAGFSKIPAEFNAAVYYGSRGGGWCECFKIH